MVKTNGENAVKVILCRGEKKGKCTKVRKWKRGGGEGQMHLIKLHHKLKYNAHDQNYKMILAIGCIDMCKKSTSPPFEWLLDYNSFLLFFMQIFWNTWFVLDIGCVQMCLYLWKSTIFGLFWDLLLKCRIFLELMFWTARCFATG